MTVFVDTSALYALLDADDRFHTAARAAWSDLVAADDPLLTSNYVLVETFALVQRRLGMNAVRACADRLLPVIDVAWVEQEDHRNALAGVVAAGRRDLSLVDFASFVVMRRDGLRTAFTFDPHFAEQGFDAVPTTKR